MLQHGRSLLLRGSKRLQVYLINDRWKVYGHREIMHHRSPVIPLHHGKRPAYVTITIPIPDLTPKAFMYVWYGLNGLEIGPDIAPTSHDITVIIMAQRMRWSDYTINNKSR